MSVIERLHLDPRCHAYRPDLAASSLRGSVEALRFVEGVPKHISAAVATMRGEPHEQARTTTQLLHGERVTAFEEADGWAWVQNETDGYVGYVPAGALGDLGPEPTHRVAALRSFVFPQPDLKTQPSMVLSFRSAVAVEGEENGWARLASGGWIYGRHLSREAIVPDYPTTAIRFVGVPYLWGGRTSLGLDCSALVQLSLAAAGLPCPRDSDMQREAVGTAVDKGCPYRRGDLVFFPGHVGIMVDGERMAHANAFHMAVAVEPLADAAARVPITAVRRL